MLNFLSVINTCDPAGDSLSLGRFILKNSGVNNSNKVLAGSGILELLNKFVFILLIFILTLLYYIPFQFSKVLIVLVDFLAANFPYLYVILIIFL